MNDQEAAQDLYQGHDWESGNLQEYAQAVAYRFSGNTHGGCADVVRALIQYDKNCKRSVLEAQARDLEKEILANQTALAEVLERITTLRGES